MRAKLQGVAFEIPSPSYYALAVPDCTQFRGCDIAYVDGYWLMTLVFPNGKQIQKVFPTRDEAVSVIARAYRSVGLLQ